MANIERFSRLQILNMSGNEIQQIEGLEKLSFIQKFDASRNKITHVPDSINSCVSLEVLLLYGNYIC